MNDRVWLVIEAVDVALYLHESRVARVLVA